MVTVNTSADRWVVYRCYDAQDNLLYVGMTSNLGRRLAEHAEKIWFLDVQAMTFVRYKSEKAADAAERTAIYQEHPRLNVVHNGSSPRPPRLPPKVWQFKPAPEPGASPYDRFLAMMREVPIGGIKAMEMWCVLGNEGHQVARETVSRWLSRGIREGRFEFAGGHRYRLVRMSGQESDQGPVSL